MEDQLVHTSEVVRETYRDPVLFCKYFLENPYFPVEIPWLHRGLLAILTGRTEFLWEYGQVAKIVRNFTSRDREGHITDQLFHVRVPNATRHLTIPEIEELEARGGRATLELNLRQYTLLMIPRGFGKTTVAGVAYGLYNILFQEIPFAAYVSEAAPHAKIQLNNIKRELESNEKILSVFGDVRPDRNDSEKWTEDLFETMTHCSMVARGRGSQVRGLNFHGDRPKHIVCDDLEDKESVETEYQRSKTRTWAYGDLMPALADDGRLTAMGTKLHEECLLETWANDPRFSVVKFGALDLDGEYLWPRKMDAEKVELTKQAFASARQLHTFYLEYFNQSTSAETNPFQDLEIQREYVDATTVVASAVYVDPAISEKTSADDTVVGVASRLQNGKIVLREMWGGRVTVREMIDKYFELALLYTVRFHGYESVAFQASLKHTFVEEMFRKGHYFEPIPVPHTTKKASRFLGILQPRLAAGYIVAEKAFPKLEQQLRDWNPEKKEQKDDWPDCACGLVELLDPVAASAAGVDMGKDIYPPLSEEIGTDWRWM